MPPLLVPRAQHGWLRMLLSSTVSLNHNSILNLLTVGIGHELADIEAIDNLLSLENVKS